METTVTQDLESRIDGLKCLLENKPLSFREACRYLDLSASYLYKLTHRKAIPYYKPTGKKIFFDRSQLDAFLRQGPVTTMADRLERISSPRLGRKLSQAKVKPQC